MCKVENSDFKTSLLSHCSSRSDSLADSVKFHLLSVIDQVAAKAQYHKTCYTNFVTNRGIPNLKDMSSGSDVKKFKVGRKVDEEAQTAFIEVADYLISPIEEQITIHRSWFMWFVILL